MVLVVLGRPTRPASISASTSSFPRSQNPRLKFPPQINLISDFVLNVQTDARIIIKSARFHGQYGTAHFSRGSTLVPSLSAPTSCVTNETPPPLLPPLQTRAVAVHAYIVQPYAFVHYGGCRRCSALPTPLEGELAQEESLGGGERELALQLRTAVRGLRRGGSVARSCSRRRRLVWAAA